MISSGPTFSPNDAKTRLAPVRAIMPYRIFSSKVMSATVGAMALLRLRLYMILRELS